MHTKEETMDNVVSGLQKEEEVKSSAVRKLLEEHDYVLKTFRLLIADLCQQFNGGHLGYAPHTLDYFNHDRFVLLNAMTLDQLKSYYSDRVDALCPGHPKIEHEGIEVTTRPLGQGVANACMVRDACLQEGVALEAISVDLTNTEDVNAKMRACRWDVVDIKDRCFDVGGIVKALNKVRVLKERPTFVNVRTITSIGSAVAGGAVAHGVAFSADDVANIKKVYAFNPEEHFVISDKMRNFFTDIQSRDYEAKFPKLGAEFWRRMAGELPKLWKNLIPSKFPKQSTSTRAASGLVFNPVAMEVNNFIVSTADLSPLTTCGMNGNYGGRYVHYGVQEHAMCAISNGLAAFAPNTFVLVTSFFFMFYLYAAPAVRMGALQQLQVIYLATHDSIRMGEDGLTYQPIELAALYRAMPNLLFIRPGDSEETAGAWTIVIESKKTPTTISTSRQGLPQLARTRRVGVAKGAYVLEEVDEADVTLIGVGAELFFAIDIAHELRSTRNIKARVISFPCQRLFEAQSQDYKRATLRRDRGIPAVVIEPYTPNGWERYADEAICVKTFGHSLPGKAAYKYFGFEVGPLTAKVGGYLQRIKADPALKHEFVDL
ncbi:Thiamin diphosphate-binding protein [Clohesyomyces aquaticus]|uniref:Thiamin diphosphate-binding protein n=1 Tax=Clohesyomyces aquaticus TaxID=1231657 RepID=A0A1Y1Y7B9_9PLEO|nr:Thiamin diphosphate-binding protein [Clohesyomyces aquaticus]